MGFGQTASSSLQFFEGVIITMSLLHFVAASLTSCQMEYQERLRNWLLPGPYIPQCSHQGQYEPMQCYESYCFCVNEHGVELVGSRVDKTEGKPNCNDGGNYLTTFCQQYSTNLLKSPESKKTSKMEKKIRNLESNEARFTTVVGSLFYTSIYKSISLQKSTLVN